MRVDDRRVALPGTWERMACVLEVLRPNGRWCDIPSEIVPAYLRGVLESQAVLSMDESMNKEFARKLRNEHVLLQVMRMSQRPGHQCLSWIVDKGGTSSCCPQSLSQRPMVSRTVQ